MSELPIADDIVRDWLEELRREGGSPPRSEPLLAGYRRLALAALVMGLDGDSEATFPEIGEALAAVVTENRRSGLSISTTLEDIGRLIPAAVARLRSEDPRVGGEADAKLGRIEAAVRALGAVQHQLVTLLEASAARALRERARALASIMDMVSHELKNRLGAAQTASRMLLSTELEMDGEYRERLARLLQKSVDDALRTVGDVSALAGSRANAGGEMRPVPLSHLVHSVVEESRPAAKEAGVELCVPDDLTDVPVDPARMRLILFNLVVNGIKYHDGAKERPMVEIRARQTDRGFVEVEVTDNGIGIPEDEVDDIFLYRTRGSAAGDDVAGSGLGLAIVKEAIDQIEGRVLVESRVGEGTRFTVRVYPPDVPDPEHP